MFPGSDGGGAQSLREIARIYIDSLREDAVARPDRWQRAAVRAEDGEKPSPRVGDMWLTGGSSDAPPALVVITWVGDGIHRAVVTLDEPELAAADDILVSAEQSVLGVPIALCAWRDLPVAETDLWRLVGSLPDTIIEPLAMLLQSSLTGGFRRRALGASRLSTGEAGVRWTIESNGDDPHAVEYLSGAPILGDSDPRLPVRQEIVKFTAYLEHGALQGLTVHADDGEAEQSNEPASFPPARGVAGRLTEFPGPTKRGIRISVEPLPYAAAAQGELTVGQLPPGRYSVNVKDAEGQGLRAQVQIQPYAGALRVRFLNGHQLLLKETGVALSADRWAVLRSYPETSLSMLLQEELRMKDADIRLEDLP